MMCGIYIHVPFCQKKCPYCDFYSLTYTQDLMDGYTEAVIRRLSDYKEKKIAVDTIYFGGGTPNLLGFERISKILNTIYDCFNVCQNCEITLEANPESFSKQDIQKFYKSGINRLSFGLQSTNQNELISLGRTHTTEQVKRCIKLAKSAEITNISLDLMLGIEGQTEKSLSKSIKFCADLGITHISAYLLKIEPNTPFYKRRALLSLPDEDITADLYSFAVSELEKYGYVQYEISNFAKNNMFSRHNLKYWNCEEYIGIGPSAHGYFRGERYFYERNLKGFISNPQKVVFDCYGGGAEEEFMLALRLSQGIDLKNFCSKHSLKISPAFKSKALSLEKAGLVTFKNDIIKITPSGFLVSNSIISDLILALGL